MPEVGGEDRRVPFSEVERRRSLPGVAEATDSFELVGAVVADERAEDAARPDRAELVRVADEDHLRFTLLHEMEQLREVVGARHAGLVEDDDAAVVEEERRASTVGVEEELRERVGAQPRLVTQHRRRHRRGREPDRIEAGPDPCFARRVERAGLAGSCRTDEERDALAAGDEPAHRITLVLAEARAVEHACGNRLRHHRRVRVPAARDELEHRGLPPERRTRREARCPVALALGHAVPPAKRRRDLDGEG